MSKMYNIKYQLITNGRAGGILGRQVPANSTTEAKNKLKAYFTNNLTTVKIISCLCL